MSEVNIEEILKELQEIKHLLREILRVECLLLNRYTKKISYAEVYEKIIVDELRTKTYITVSDVEALLNVSKPTALKILKSIAIKYPDEFVFAEAENKRAGEETRLINKRLLRQF